MEESREAHGTFQDNKMAEYERKKKSDLFRVKNARTVYEKCFKYQG